MVPVPLATPASRVAGLIDAVAAWAHDWNQPLVARLLPSALHTQEQARFEHPFIANTRPLQLEAQAFCEAAQREVFFAPAAAAQLVAAERQAEFAVG
jgi:hypothetical protein